MTGGQPRDTRQKRAIRAVLEGAERPLSIDEIRSNAARRSRGLGVATVYRAVRSLVDEGVLTAVEVPGRAALYELTGKGHHHHFVCESCGTVHELTGCESTITMQLPRGFRAREHDITVYGTCADCASRRKRQPAPAP